MNKWLHRILWVIAIILIANFAILMIYGDTLRSTHLFIVRGTVFYPVAWINLIFGLALIFILIWRKVHEKKSK